MFNLAQVEMLDDARLVAQLASLDVASLSRSTRNRPICDSAPRARF
jgi:hypothetical protein